MISAFCRHMTNDELIQRAVQLMIMIMHDQQKVEGDVLNDFIQKQAGKLLFITVDNLTHVAFKYTIFELCIC